MPSVALHAVTEIPDANAFASTGVSPKTPVPCHSPGSGGATLSATILAARWSPTG